MITEKLPDDITSAADRLRELAFEIEEFAVDPPVTVIYKKGMNA